MMEKRKHPRIKVRNMHADVSDGLGCCSTTVGNVSRLGLCLADIALRFGKNIADYTVVASCENRHFKFRVRARWERVGGSSKLVGLEIHEPPRQWLEYVLLLESRMQVEGGGLSWF